MTCFLERAIVGERLRDWQWACHAGGAAEPCTSYRTDIALAADQAEGYYTPPLINVIKFACNACAEKESSCDRGVSGMSGSSVCMEVCPKKAVYS